MNDKLKIDHYTAPASHPRMIVIQLNRDTTPEERHAFYSENIAKAETPPPTWWQRLLKEHEELAAKCQSLKLYMMTDAFKQLSKAERYNLEMQSRHMAGYLSVLDVRIAYYEATR